ncbi:MAG: hypothetical protein IJK43_15200 [Prevotella sp.]|nr:hypothetical protein [Prevotella sp.]
MIKNNETPKPKPRKVRGTGTYVGDEFTFKPCAEGEPTQRDVKSCKNGKLFTTTSEKKPLQVAHLSCPADSPDPWAEYTRRLIQLGVKPKQEERMPERQRVVSEGGMEVFLNATQGKLIYQGCIDLTLSHNWQSELMRQMQVIVRTLPVEERFTKLLTKIKKGGMK